MVKGVSKTVIVVNNTGNKFFEKIVFYVTPEYSSMSTGKLNSAAAKYIGTFDLNPNPKTQLRRRYRKRLILKYSIIAAVALLAITGIVSVIL